MNINYTPENTFIFSFVRMNPPTPGHMSLIETMINKAADLGSNKVYIITSSSLDGKNPLPCSADAVPKPKNKTDASIVAQFQQNLIYKSSVLNNMITSYKQQLIDSSSDASYKSKIENINVIVVCSVGSPFSFIYELVKRDFIDKGTDKINMFFIVGRDRADFLDTIVDTFKTKNYINSVSGLVLPREGMETLKNSGLGKRSISDISQSEYSASFVRNLVKNNQRDDFERVYERYLSPTEIEKLYVTIKNGMLLKQPPSKVEDENPQSEYYDGNKLPVMGPSSGGKTRFKYTRKQRKSKRKKTKRHHIKRQTKKYK